MTRDTSEVTATRAKLSAEAEAGGYHLNPDNKWTDKLVEGLLVNEERYGYPACPCRLATGSKSDDLDIICPCDYRDQDLVEYGACYCGLYVSDDIASGERQITPVPERRSATAPKPEATGATQGTGLWRCRVCGYLCAREHPPGICPVCRAKSDRFEPFVLPAAAIPTRDPYRH